LSERVYRAQLLPEPGPAVRFLVEGRRESKDWAVLLATTEPERAHRHYEWLRTYGRGLTEYRVRTERPSEPEAAP
jgi:hypothetical protein